MENIEAILKQLKFIKPKVLKVLLDYYNEKKSLMLMENYLDKLYFDFVVEFAKQIPEHGILFKEFLLSQVDVLNVKLLIRLKREKLEKEKIIEMLCGYGDILPKSKIKRLVEMDIHGILENLETTELKNIIKKHKKDVIEGKSLLGLESDLDKFLLKKASLLIHQHPLTLDVILGYMFAKEIEVRNLRMIVKGKQLGVNEEFLALQVIA